MRPALKVTTESPELADRFNRILSETAGVLDGAGVSYGFIGGIASSGMGRPRSTHDIDVFVRQEDAEIVLRALAKRGFRTEKTDPAWLYKAFKDDILVDIIFKSKGEIYFDPEMVQRVITTEYHGKKIRTVAPEDLVIIKALAHSELTPNHWHDALALLSHANIDWDYLVRRGRRAPRRVLALLLYAQSADIGVPKHVIDQFYLVCFGDTAPGGKAALSQVPHHRITSAVRASGLQPPGAAHSEVNSVAHLRERLAEDPRTNELDIQIERSGMRFLLRGEVLTDERHRAVIAVAQELFPDCQIDSQIRVMDYPEPTESEEVK